MSKLEDKLNPIIEKNAIKLSADIRTNAGTFKGSGKYAGGWTYKRNGKKTAIVYNETQPSLAHLLENGHVIANQHGTYGYYKGKKHIGPAVTDSAKEFKKSVITEVNKYIQQAKNINDL